MSKYQLVKKKVKVGFPNGFKRYDPRAKRMVHVKPYTRNQKIKVATYALIIKRQKAESDWSHQSYEYPNLLGLSDKEVEKFIEESGGKHWSEDDKVTKEYIKHIKCLDKDDIRKLSKKAYKKFDTRMRDKHYTGEFSDNNPYNKDSTIFITSPRGGFNILGDFGYANKLDKKNFPYDLEKSGHQYPTLKAESLPYGYSISDVNDIVFIDDIYMSGEQCYRVYGELEKKINELNIPQEQKPRLHYMAMVGDKHTSQGKSKWNTFTIGEEYNFRRDGKNFKGVSAVVFPFSIPDGHRHQIARKLYRNKKRFAHRTS